MAKRRGRKPLLVARFLETQIVAAIVNNGIESSTLVDASDQECFLISMDVNMSLGTHIAGEGPLFVGVAHGDYSEAEILEWFQQSNGLSTGDLVTREQAKRLIREIGVFSGVGTEEVMNDGKKIRVPLKFRLQDGVNLNLFTVNLSGATLTANSQINAVGKIYAKRM